MRQRRLHDIGREGERGGDRPRSDAAVVRAVRRAPSLVAEEAPLFSFDCVSRRPGTIARGDSPGVFAVGLKTGWIGNRILLMNIGRAAAIFEIIDLFVTHIVVLNSSKVDPDMGELVDEERSRIEKLMIVDHSPVVSGGPPLPAFAR